MKVLRVLRKDEKNVTIYFDNDEKLIVSEDVFYNSGLRKGDELSEDRYSFFIEENKCYYIKQKALQYIARRFHSEKELYIKLKTKSYEDKLIRNVLLDLKSNSFIDDTSFANHFIEEKLKKKKWGINKIKSALYSKGVAPEIINELLKLHHNENDNIDTAVELAKKKILIFQNRKFDKKQINQKLITFLLSRGFDYETSMKASKNLIKEDEDFN